MSEHPENESTNGSEPPADGPHEGPLEVLEDDENVPPRPEEAAADSTTRRPDGEADGV